MLKSIILTALRNFIRNKSFSLINLIGLSVSMSLAMLIIMIVKEQLTFDNFHVDSDRVYRLNTMALRVDGGQEPYASSPLPLGEALKEYSFAEEVVSINVLLRGDLIYGKVNVPIQGFITDPAFFRMFNFSLEKGDAETALARPDALILTAASAERIFGQEDAMGKTVSISGFGDFTVTGVLSPFKGKTHLEFEALASFAALPGWQRAGLVGGPIGNWNNYYSTYNYIKLKPGHDENEIKDALSAIVKKSYAGLKLETRDRGYEFYTQALNAITPGPGLSNQMGRGMPTLLLVFLGTLASVVLVMSIFNFTNLMIAKSLTRSREIGVRKVIGAKRAQVFYQFIGETIVFALVALIFSYPVLQFLKVAYLQLPLNADFAISLEEDFGLILLFIVFAVFVGIVAGILPAAYLSTFKPLQVLKEHGRSMASSSRMTFRKSLMTIQFSLSVMFVIVVSVIFRQIDFMLTADYGINQKNILNIRLQGVPFEAIANDLRSITGVERVGGLSHPLGTWSDRASDYRKDLSDAPFTMRDFIVDRNYIENLQMKFLAGGNFATDRQSPSGETEVILNESALARFNFASPSAAVGEVIYVDSSALQVVGVVKDFHFRPLITQIGPLALRTNSEGLQFASALINPDRKDAVIASLSNIWKKYDRIHPLEYKMFEEEIDDAYRQGGMTDILMVVGYITLLTVTLACLGVLGMSMYATRTRVKEIGVRKVMGASVPQVVMLLGKSFLVLMVIAATFGVPSGILLGNFFLGSYTYKIEISLQLVLSAVMLIIGLGILMICSQTIHAARANPVKSLRYE